MADITVIGPDGKRFTFPEGTDREVMKSALRRHYTGANAQTREMIMGSELPNPETQGARDYLSRQQLVEDIRAGREVADMEAALGPENLAKERFYTAAQGQTLGAAPILQGAVNVPISAAIYPFLSEEEKAGRSFGEFVNEMSGLGYDQARGSIARAREKRPLESAGIELAGGLLTGKTAYDELGKRFLASRAGARGATVGAGAGGQYGFLEGEGDLGQAATGAAIGAPLGAGLGKTVEAVADPLGRMFRGEKPLVLGPADEVLTLDRPVFAEDARAAQNAQRQTIGVDMSPQTRTQVISDRGKTDMLNTIAQIQDVIDARKTDLEGITYEAEATRKDWVDALAEATRRINREYGTRYRNLGSKISIATRGAQDYRTSVAEELADVILRERGIDPTKVKQDWVKPRKTNERAAKIRSDAAKSRAELEARMENMTEADYAISEFEDNYPDIDMNDFLRRATEDLRLNMPAEEMTSDDIIELAGRYAKQFDAKGGKGVTDLERIGKQIWDDTGYLSDTQQLPRPTRESIEADVSKALGPLYHGSPGKIEGQLRPSSDGLFGPGVYLTPDKTRAGAYAGQNGEVVQADLSGKLASYEDWKNATRKIASGMQPGTNTLAQIQQKAVAELESQGFVGVQAGDTVTVWNPANLNAPKIIQAAKSEGYQGADTGESAEWIAAKRKGLDMSTSARMARAKEMGFDTDTVLYRGSVDNSIGEGWFSNSAETAETYARGTGTVMPVHVRLKNPLVVDAEGANYFMIHRSRLIEALGRKADKKTREGVTRPTPEEIVRVAKANGYDGVIIKNVKDNAVGVRGSTATTYNIFDPANIRSVHAAFDPAKKGRSDLLAAAPLIAGGAGLGAAANQENQ